VTCNVELQASDEDHGMYHDGHEMRGRTCLTIFVRVLIPAVGIVVCLATLVDDDGLFFLG